jgi:hypothetical protein
MKKYFVLYASYLENKYASGVKGPYNILFAVCWSFIFFFQPLTIYWIVTKDKYELLEKAKLNVEKRIGGY